MKQDVMVAIENARVSLDQAMVGLEDMPETNAEIVSYTAHKLKNYLTVVGATAELLEVYFAGHPDEQLKIWIEGLQHAVHLMSHDAGRLDELRQRQGAGFWSEKVDVALLVFRVCNFYRRKADWKNIQIHTELQPEGCLASTDRVALAASWTTCCRTRSSSPRTAGGSGSRSAGNRTRSSAPCATRGRASAPKTRPACSGKASAWRIPRRRASGPPDTAWPSPRTW